MQHVPLLTTLERVRAQRRLGADATGDDELLKTLIAAASAEFARETGRVCVPYYTVRHYDMPLRSPYALDLDEDLLELAALTNGDGTSIPIEAVAPTPMPSMPGGHQPAPIVGTVLSTQSTMLSEGLSM